jgi:hypothetical protein
MRTLPIMLLTCCVFLTFNFFRELLNPKHWICYASKKGVQISLPSGFITLLPCQQKKIKEEFVVC